MDSPSSTSDSWGLLQLPWLSEGAHSGGPVRVRVRAVCVHGPSLAAAGSGSLVSLWLAVGGDVFPPVEPELSWPPRRWLPDITSQAFQPLSGQPPCSSPAPETSSAWSLAGV